jgi:hypothetical protein
VRSEQCGGGIDGVEGSTPEFAHLSSVDTRTIERASHEGASQAGMGRYVVSARGRPEARRLPKIHAWTRPELVPGAPVRPRLSDVRRQARGVHGD